MSPQRHITQIFLCSATEQIAQCVLAINGIENLHKTTIYRKL